MRLREARSPVARLGFVGDLAPGLAGHRPIRADESLLGLLRSCDQVVANLEGPLTDAPGAKEWGIVLRSAPASVRELHALNVRAVNLANNHSIDCGAAGLEDTRRLLDGEGIGSFGAGRDEAEATAPLVRETAAGPVAFVGYTVPFADMPSVASRDTPGAAMLDLEKARERIASLRRAGYLVCVSFHGGYEYFRVPCAPHLAALRALADAGAHVVMGHHAHVFQGIEVRGGSLIACGLGNFCFTWPRQIGHSGRSIGLVLAVELDHDGVCGYATHFTLNRQRAGSVSLIGGAAAGALRSLLAELSAALRDPASHRRAWRRDCARMALALNVAAGLWPIRLVRRAAFMAGCLMRMPWRRGVPRGAAGVQRHMCSARELLWGALQGLPDALLHLGDTLACYRAYRMAGERGQR